jgi:hypothetical protein
MKRIRIIALILLGASSLFLAAPSADGQRLGGRAGGAAAASSVRGGAAVGPFGGAGAAIQNRQTVVGPNGAAAAGAGRGSFTTNRGTTIDYAGAGQKVAGPGGATAGRGVGAIQITGANGQQYTKVGAARGAAGPNGAVGQKASIGVGTGPNGAAASINRGGIAVGPGGAVAAKSRVGVAAGPNGLAGYTARGVSVGHRTVYVPPARLPVQGAYVRRSFVHYNAFQPTWYTAHPHAWRAAAWTAAAFWRGAAWATVASSCGYPPAPVVYDYGSTIVYVDNRVYYNGEPVATAEEYTDQAAAIADRGEQAQPTEKDEWISLGVFGMVKGEETEANQIFQLAINKNGILRGNYYDALSDSTLPVFGSVDKKTQRAAWTVGDRKETVYETGVGNLTEAETTMLVHFGKDRTQQWTLIRLEEPDQTK